MGATDCPTTMDSHTHPFARLGCMPCGLQAQDKANDKKLLKRADGLSSEDHLPFSSNGDQSDRWGVGARATFFNAPKPVPSMGAKANPFIPIHEELGNDEELFPCHSNLRPCRQGESALANHDRPLALRLVAKTDESAASPRLEGPSGFNSSNWSTFWRYADS